MTATRTEHNFVDPVCRMKIVAGSKVPSFVFESETYHFCADSCRKAFMADPEKYLKAETTKRKGFWGRYLDRLNKATGGKPPCCH
jgi:YHS domain-containing protein